MAYYNTEEAAYVLDAGDYVVRVGTLQEIRSSCCYFS